MNRLIAIGTLLLLLMITSVDSALSIPVLVVSGTIKDDKGSNLGAGLTVQVTNEDRQLTATTTTDSAGKYIVTLGVWLFAFSTMISWSYYGEKGTEYLLGPQAILPYKFVFVIFVFLGMMLPEFKWVYNFSDTAVGLMVFCNLPAVLILSPTVLRAAKGYFHRLDGGQMPRLDRASETLR